jgi:hypothetical protein
VPDRVNRLPRFLLNNGDELGGFAKATDHALLAAEPPSSKSGSVLEALARMSTTVALCAICWQAIVRTEANEGLARHRWVEALQVSDCWLRLHS